MNFFAMKAMKIFFNYEFRIFHKQQAMDILIAVIVNVLNQVKKFFCINIRFIVWMLSPNRRLFWWVSDRNKLNSIC